MKRIFALSAIFAAAALIFVGCTVSTRTYDKNGISFSYPGDWSIMEDDFDGSLGYLTVAKGTDATATIAWLKSEGIAAEQMIIQSYLDDMQANLPITDLVSEPAAKTDFGVYPATAVTYTASVNGVPHSGTVWAFKAEGCIVNVGIREAVGAHNANLPGFETIESTFDLK